MSNRGGRNGKNGPSRENGDGGEARSGRRLTRMACVDFFFSDDGEHPWGWTTAAAPRHGLLAYQCRSPLFGTLSRSSSGYFSFDFDSLPSSPVMTNTKSTQTPSPSSQVIVHVIEQMRQQLRQHELAPVSHQPHAWVAQELQHIGDEFERICLRRDSTRTNVHAARPVFQQIQNDFGVWQDLCLFVGQLLRIFCRTR